MAWIRWTCLVAAAVAFLSRTAGAAPADETFQSLYGAKLQKAKATADTSDDAALAKEILGGLGITEDQPELRRLMCVQAYELGITAPEGYATAVRAMEILCRAEPRSRQRWQGKLLAAHELRYDASGGPQRTEAAEGLVTALLDAAKWQVESENLAAAIRYARRAREVARAAAPALKQTAELRLRGLEARHVADKTVRRMSTDLEADPSDTLARTILIRAYLVELDDPVEAAALLTPACAAELRSYVQLAAKNDTDLLADDCLALADWYCSLVAGPGPGGRPAMVARVRRYYGRYVWLGGGSRPTSQEVKQRVQRIRELLSRPRELSREIRAYARRRASLPPEEQLASTVRKLRELNGCEVYVRPVDHGGTAIRDGKVVALDFGRLPSPMLGGPLDTNQRLENIDPLHGLPLRWLSLRGCSSLRGDLWALAGMKLKYLDLSGCMSLDSLAGIEGMPLETLILPPGAHIAADAHVLTRLKMLTSLTVQGPCITDLRGLTGSGITSVTIRCSPITSLEGLKGLKPNHLTLYRCFALASLDGVEEMPLVSVSVIECPSLREDDYRLLGRIPTLTDIRTGDGRRDRRIARMARRRRGD